MVEDWDLEVQRVGEGGGTVVFVARDNAARPQHFFDNYITAALIEIR